MTGVSRRTAIEGIAAATAISADRQLYALNSSLQECAKAFGKTTSGLCGLERIADGSFEAACNGNRTER